MTQISSQDRSSLEPINVFISYAERDDRLVKQLRMHLQSLVRQSIIRIWDREISVGAEWRREINSRINSSQLILFLLSPDFLSSDYSYGAEVQQAFKRYNSGKARIIPVLLRPVDIRNSPFDKLVGIPRNGRSITTSKDADIAFLEITQEILMVCRELQEQIAHSSTQEDSPLLRIGEPPESSIPITNNPEMVEATEKYPLYNVFVRSNIPGVTFVEHPNFQRLKLYLQEPNRGVVLEGPSGVGKTTALRKALEDLELQAIDDPFVSTDSDILKEQYTGTVFLFNARNPKHQQKLTTLRHWHQGMITIDDLHYLPTTLHQDLVNYLKELADGIVRTKKLVLVGIPYTGQTLVNTAYDVAMRIDVLKFGTVKDELILQMIEVGEKALNVIFDRKSEIAIASNGSLNIAQYLCYNLCANAGIRKSQENQRAVVCDVVTEVETVVDELSKKFGDTVKHLAAMGGIRDRTGLKLLEELANNEGILSLSMLKVTKPELNHGIDQFIHNRWIEDLYQKHPDSKRFLFYNPVNYTLIIDDPQFMFYLKKISFPVLAKEVGKLAERVAKKAFVSYSHIDADWLRKLQVRLAPMVHEDLIKLWDDQKLIIGSRWRDEIQQAIESSTIAVLLVGPYFLASEFIKDFELPQILEKARTGGTTVVSLIVDYCSFEGSGLDEFQTANSPSNPLIAMTLAEQSKTLNDLATKIKNKLLTDMA